MNNQPKNLYSFQKEWEVIVEKAFSNFASLNPEERIWFNLQSLCQAIDDGGLLSYYFNSYADYWPETIEDLNKLGFTNVAENILEMNRLFPSNYPSRNMIQRNVVIDEWPEGIYNNIIENLEQRITKIIPEIENRLVQHIEQKILNK